MKMQRLLDEKQLTECIDHLASALRTMVEPSNVSLVGIRRRGVPLAERVADRLAKSLGNRPEVGALDITFYRDDLSRVAQQPVVGVTEIPFPVDDQVICLVDDVLYTGRTIRAAIDAIMEFGRPQRILLAVLVDRGHRELPIQADLVGKTVETELTQDIKVCLAEIDGQDEVYIEDVSRDA